MGFNSRTREGCDSVHHVDAVALVKFQFTHPGGVRLLHGVGAVATRQVSIHAPGRGATNALPAMRGLAQFQFTHPGGVRQYGAKLRIMGRINKRNLRLEVLL